MRARSIIVSTSCYPVSGTHDLTMDSSASLVSNDNKLVADYVGFKCLKDNNVEIENRNMVDTDCSRGLRAQVNFQDCW